MKKTLFIISFLVLISCDQNNTKSKSPNIILITVDDLGWKDLGFMGSKYYETPFLDKLASQSMVFTNAYAGAANCAPSRASLMSGLNTPKHGIYTVGSSQRGETKTRKLIAVKNKKYLHDSIYTLPEMLKSAGYKTAHFGKWHIGENPKTQGIDYNIGGSKRGNPGRNGYFSPYNIDFIENKKSDEYLTDRLTSEAINFIKKNYTSPFFINLAFYSVHTPLQGKENLIQKYNLKQGVNGQENSIYGSMVSSVDENIGRILNIIDESKLTENTLIIFTSDNGGIRAISNQYPLRAGKGSYYEGGIRVPFIMKWPNKIDAGVNKKTNVSHLDIYRTLQEIVNPKIGVKKLDGINLKSQFKGPSQLERDIFYHFPIYLEAYNKIKDHGRDTLFRTRPGSVIISGKWKLHHYFEDNGTELYNLETDIGESDDLSDKEPKIVERLKHSLENWRLKEKAFIPNEKNPFYSSIF